MKKGLVSVIIPTYNRSHLIGETLDSVIAQTYQNWECIVVDDGSNDYTEELLEFYCKKDDRIKFYKRPPEKPKGANACRNYGFELSTGEFINWFDSDDLMQDNCLSRKLKKIQSQNFDGCICDTAYFYENDFKKPVFVTKNSAEINNYFIDYLAGAINMTTQSILWHRKFLTGSRFNEKLIRAQELDFHFQLLKNKDFKVSYINEVLVFIRGHSKSLTGDYKSGKLESINCELSVSLDIMKYVKDLDFDTSKKHQCLKRYLDAIRNLYLSHSISSILSELKSFEKIMGKSSEYQKWKYNLILLVLLFKLTGREYRLKKNLYSLKLNDFKR